MQENPNCPVCNSNCWQVIAERVHAYEDREKLSSYEQSRYDVLFEIWLPGQQSIRMTSNLCGECGFVTYLPRPEAADVDAKYRFLEEHVRDYGEQESHAVERARSTVLWKLLKTSLPTRGAILDFGGGDGRLMRQFANQGHSCLLVDYNKSPRQFVTKIANTLDEVPSDLQVDAIVCSHVMEHVVDPVGEMRKLGEHLRPNGVLFVEVPLEIWKRAPLHSEPVTHINFFTRASLHRALQEADFVVQSCHYVGSLHPTGRVMPAIRAFANRLGPVARACPNGPREARLLLNPGLIQKLKRWWFLSRGKREMYSAKSQEKFA